jgi:type VI secretion system secreted protein VgrG
MEIDTPLGDDLLFYGLHAREELGRLSTLQIELLSTNGKIAIDGILGKNVTVKTELPDDSTRCFNGYVTRFSQGGTYGRYFRYTALAQPWLWFLTRTSDCRIFQEMTVPDILKKVLGECEQNDVKYRLSGTYRKWTYCVQYRETDFNFVSRLMEHEGIYYYFTHEEGRHTMVVTDSTGGHDSYPGYATVKFISPERVARPDIEHIRSWDLTRQIQPGTFVQTDYDFERPSVNLKTQKAMPRGYAPSSGEMYDYPGVYMQKADGEALAGVRIGEYAAQFEHAQAVTNARGMSTGCLFTLDGCPRDDQNCEHLILSSTHDLEYSQYEALPNGGAVDFRCQFAAMTTNEPFRPKRMTPKPFVQGPQTAVVVGPGGDEIYTDKYGRVKVQFHWDRYGEKNENSSCWIRVSTPWAGKGWGGVSTPRIGQEVIVDFLEGDPDQPIITGRVYNAEQMPPYALPANKTQTGVKTRSSLYGEASNFNEIRFEDKKGSEQLYIHAEKNQDIEVENDETHWVGHDRKKTIDNDETSHIKHDRTETVDNDETISIGANRTESVEKDESITIGKNRTESVGDDETITIGKNQSLSVGSNRTKTVSKDESTTVSGNRTEQVSQDEEVSVGKSRQVSIGENDTLKVGKKLVLDAGDQITLHTGSASITLKKDGTITIKGKDITLEGSGKINVKASSDVSIKGSKIAQN